MNFLYYYSIIAPADFQNGLPHEIVFYNGSTAIRITNYQLRITCSVVLIECYAVTEPVEGRSIITEMHLQGDAIDATTDKTLRGAKCVCS